MEKSRRPPWFIVVFLIVGLGITYGGFSIYGDQHSGTPGTAEVSECEGGTKYQPGIHCRGSWRVDGRLVLGRVEGADKSDEGKTVDVRIHGTDHATVPALATPIVLWVLGIPITLLCLFGLWNWARDGRRREPDVDFPPAIQQHLTDLLRLRWNGKDPQPVLDALPRSLPHGVVTRLASGGPFGWLIEGRLDRLGSRVALEALEDDRMSGPSHYRVWDDGSREELPTERTGYLLPKDYTPEDEARVKEEWAAHNRGVQELLRERGFLPG